MKKPSQLVERVRDGVLTLATIPLPTLLDWVEHSECWIERDMLGHEIMYRNPLGGNCGN